MTDKDAMIAHGKSADEENERLREALKKIEQRANETRTGPLGYQETVFAMHEIARKALLGH